MKIALGVRHFRMVGGQERFTLRLADYLKNRGHQIAVYAISGLPVEGVDLHLIPAPHFCPRFRRDWVTGSRIADHLARAKVDVTFGEQKIWNVNVVRPGGGVEATYWDYHLARKWKSKRLARLVSGLYPKRFYDLHAETKSLLNPSTRAIILNSNLVRRDMIRCYPTTASRIHVVYNGVSRHSRNPEQSSQWRREIRNKFGISGADRVALFIGHDFYRKGLGSAIQAVAQTPEWHLLVAGRGRVEPYLLQAQKLGLSGRVHFMGDLQESGQAYAASDTLLFPSFYDPFANVTVEALGEGLPVITTSDNGGCEVIQNGSNGWIVDSPIAIDQMAAHLRQLSEPTQLNTMKQQALTSSNDCRIESRLNDIEQILAAAAR